MYEAYGGGVSKQVKEKFYRHDKWIGKLFRQQDTGFAADCMAAMQNNIPCTEKVQAMDLFAAASKADSSLHGLS